MMHANRGGRLLFAACLVLVLGTAASLLLVSGRIHDDMEGQVYQGLDASLRNATAAMRMVGVDPGIYRGKLYLGDTPVNGNNTLVDELSDSLGASATIFQMDEAVATTLRGGDSQRQTGLRMKPGRGRNAVFIEHKAFRGLETIGGEAYYVAYAPLLDREGNLVGAIQVALPRSASVARTDGVRIGGVVLAIGSLLLLSALFLLHGRDMAGRVGRQEKMLGTATGQRDLALGSMVNGLGVFGPDHRLVMASNHYVDVLGLRPGALLPGMTLPAVIKALVAEERGEASNMEALCEQVLSQVSASRSAGDLEYKWKGRILAVRHRVTPDGGWLVTYDDVTEQRRAGREIAHLAGHDPLTNLANRATFLAQVKEVVRGDSQAALFMLDIDHFATVNATMGHPAGDILLKQVAGRLRTCVGTEHGLARLDGDEFAILHPDIPDAKAATKVADRLIQELGEPFDVEGKPIRISTSIGIALPSPGDDTNTLMRKVSLALSRAKETGRNTHAFYAAGMGESLSRRKGMEEDLRSAVANGEFELFYQPIVNAMSCRLVGFEALLRWHHPTAGLVSPVEFIPIAEQTGLIIPMGAWVLRCACLDAAAWPGLKVAVNLSPVQFQDPHLVAVAKAALTASTLSPALLELEVTETALVEDQAMVVEVLSRLRALGIRIAMDDFGTGYSSLAHFRRFPFDKVKVDRMFVEGIGQRPECDAIINAVVGIAADLGMVTVAEGVENATQLHLLRDKGIQELQGFFFSRPVPLAAANHLIKQIGIHEAGAGPPRNGPVLYADHLLEIRKTTGH